MFERSFLTAAALFAAGMVAAVIVARERSLLTARWAGVAALVSGIAFCVLHARGVVSDYAFGPAMAISFALLVLYVALPRERAGLARYLKADRQCGWG